MTLNGILIYNKCNNDSIVITNTYTNYITNTVSISNTNSNSLS